MKIIFTKEKSTKNKVRYSILPQNTVDGIMGTVYLDKDCELANQSEIILEIAKITA